MTESELAKLREVIKEHQEEAKMESDIEKGAKTTRMIFDAYVAAGFNNEQALYLTATLLVANTQENNGGNAK